MIAKMNSFNYAWKVFDYAVTPTIDIKMPYGQQLRFHLSRAVSGQTPVRRIGYAAIVIIHLFLGILATPVSAVLYALGYRFLALSMRSIGGVVHLDTFIRDDRLKLKTPRHKLIVSPGFVKLANRYCYDLYRPHITLVTNPLVKMVLLPFFMNPFFKANNDHLTAPDNPKRMPFVEDKQWTWSHQVWAEHDDAFGAVPLIRLEESEIARGRELMVPLLAPGQKFVALHVRDSFFYGDHGSPASEKRNVDFTTYEPAIRYLIEKGYAVLRMGTSSAPPIDGSIARCGPKLIDYARSKLKSEFLDCYLTARCEFFIGTASGLVNLAHAFGTPSCIVNYFTASNGLGRREGDITTFRKFRRYADHSLVPFEDILRQPYVMNPSLTVLKGLGVYQEDNTPEEVFETVKDFLERRGLPPTLLQEKAKAMVPPSNYSYGAKGYFSNAILRQYFPDERVPT